MYSLILFLPLLSALVAGFGGRFIGPIGAGIITTGSIATTFILSLVAFYQVALLGSPCYIEYATWFSSGLFDFTWGLLFDSLTCTMLIVVTSVSALVHTYSNSYMEADPHRQRFMSYLSLFTFFMVVLVTGDNYLQLFMGWEGVGICSYLLINFWYGRLQANKAALKAMIVNKIGDYALALAIFLLLFYYQDVKFTSIFACANSYQNELICFLFLVGAVGKSAQLGLHTWLPDAMEGPTPVSALIHAATMVTAGVFLIARSSPLFETAPNTLFLATLVGGMTAFFAATTGLMQNDLKRVIAYSTCSQLGYMVFACGLSSYSVGVFHLATHAFFKALLFLSAGSVIHAMSDEQDMRKMGGLRNLLPFTYGMIVIGSLALMGFPFLSGFYSKDVILEMAYGSYTIEGHFAYWLGTLAAFCTAFYSLRLLALTFLKPQPQGLRVNYLNVHEAPALMAIPMGILAVGSIFFGYVTRDMLIGLGSDFWGNALWFGSTEVHALDGEFLPTSIKLIPLVVSLSGAVLSFVLYTFANKFLYDLKLSSIGRNIYTFLNRKWLFDRIYNEQVNQRALVFGYNTTYQDMDRGIVELLGPNGISSTLVKYSSVANKALFKRTEMTYSYIYTVLVGALLMVLLILSM